MELTKREREIVQLIVDGLTSQEIADKLGIAYKEAAAFDDLTEEVEPIRVGGCTEATAGAQLFSLDGRWLDCSASVTGRRIWVDSAAEPTEGGMSGSPIIDASGVAFSLVSCAALDDDLGVGGGGPNPYLVDCLPAWLVRGLSGAV